MPAMAAVVTGLVLFAFVLGYRYYARFIGDKLYDDRESIETPAHAYADGRDFVPTKRSILFGHHFTSIAGAAPILGPCIAAYWGWLPALTWVVLGTIFMGAVHDFGALVVSVREKGRSIADVAGIVISGRVRIMFLCLVMVVSWLVLAVFAMAIAGMFVAVPSAVVPVNVEIIIAIALGWLLYRRKVASFWPSVVALGLLYLFVWIGVHNPVDFTLAEADGGWGLSAPEAAKTWIYALFVYSAVASLLPVWFLMQPRDYINSHQLVVGLGLLYLGLFIAAPALEAPAIRMGDESAPAMFPFLFVTIACGAISGFHGLVSSGTTSKQLDKLSDARLIGYGSMLGEGTLALASTMAAVAGIGLVAACTLPGQGAVEDLTWAVYYDTWAHAGANKATAFVLGGGAFLQELGLPGELSKTLMAVMVISFAATTLDTATRIERFIIAEIGGATGLKVLENRYIATLIAIVPAIILATWEVSDPGSGATKQAGWVLWPIFGATNQMIAALTLMVLAIYFWRRNKRIGPLVVPMVFIMIITGISLLMQMRTFWDNGNDLLFSIALGLTVLITWMGFEGLSVLVRRRPPKVPSEPGPGA